MREISAADALSKLKPEMVVFVISIDKGGKPNGMIVTEEDCDMLMAEVLTDKGDVPFYIPVEFGSATIDALETTVVFNVVDPCTVTGVRFHLPSHVFHGQTKVMSFGSPKVVIPDDVLNISWPTPLATL